MSDERPKIVPLRRSVGYDDVKAMLETAAEVLPKDTIAAILIVQPRSGPAYPVFQGRQDALLWMLETAKLNLMLGDDDDDE